jgi:hypothetical protein
MLAKLSPLWHLARAARAALITFLAVLGTSVPRAARADPPDPLLSGELAHACVVAAWRASGLGDDDARIDAMIARAGTSALLPEASVRAMQYWSDSDNTATATTTGAMTLYDVIGSHFVIDVHLTWKLDRLVFSGEEAALERIRVERHEARSRLATRTLDALFALSRAQADSSEAVPGSREALEARLRAAEAIATLDVLTGGWFSRAEPEAVRPTSP